MSVQAAVRDGKRGCKTADLTRGVLLPYMIDCVARTWRGPRVRCEHEEYTRIVDWKHAACLHLSEWWIGNGYQISGGAPIARVCTRVLWSMPYFLQLHVRERARGEMGLD